MLLRPERMPESHFTPAFVFLLHAHDKLETERQHWDNTARIDACCLLWALARDVPIGNVVRQEP